MELTFRKRDEFYIYGFSVETTLQGCAEDIPKIISDFKANRDGLFQTSKQRNDCFGLMWYTGDKRYCYLAGLEADSPDATPNGTCCKRIPQANYAVAMVPPFITIVEAWTEFFEKAIPEAGFAPDAAHGMYFEYYPEGFGGACELWTPVVTV